MTIATKLKNKLIEMGLNFYTDNEQDFFINGKQLLTWEDCNTIALLNEDGDLVKHYKNATSAIKATF